MTLSTSIRDFLHGSLNTNEFEVLPLAGDASTRRYYRVIQSDESMVLMDWEPFTDDSNYPFLSVLKHFSNNEIHVPKVVDKSPERGLVLLEDLGDLTLERKFWESNDQELVLPFYRQAIDELVKIHYMATNDKDSACTAFNIAFDHEKLLWELNYGRKHLIETMAGITLTAVEDKELTRCFDSICDRLDKEDKYICHRDYHSRNLMIKLGKIRVIDFQDARLGPIQYDLVSLVHDSYVDLSTPVINQIIEYYLGKSAEFQPKPISSDHFNEIFQVQMIQRCFKACGSFSSFFNTRQDRRYTKYIHPTIEKVVGCLEKFPEYQAFHSILLDHQLLDINYQDL